MKVIKGVSCPEKHDVKTMAMNWLEKKGIYKDAKSGHTYKVEKYYNNHISMIDELGFRKCFQYSEIIWGLV